MVLRIRLRGRELFTVVQIRSGAKMLRLKTNAGAIDHNVITQSPAKNGRVVVHINSMAQVVGGKQIGVPQVRKNRNV